MMFPSFYSVVLCALCLALPWVPTTVFAQSGSASATQISPLPVSTACGDIFDYVNQGKSYPNNNWIYFADAVYDCLISVPFLDVVALRYINYINETIQYQSTLVYLKSPPVGYQQAAIDVQQVLNEIKSNITTGYYQTQYDFEATLQKLFRRMHDGHVYLDAGLLSAFTFGSPYSIISVSVDGIEPPKVYIKDDVIAFVNSGGPRPSAINAINGMDTVLYLTEFAQNFSYGQLEPHADWNSLMYSPVQEILLAFDIFGWDAIYYPGDELVFSFENNTDLSTYYLAFYNGLEYTGPLTTGGDYYNYFVLGNIPASYKAPTISPSTTPSTTNTTNGTDVNSTSWYSVSPAYPRQADVVQPDLSLSGTGVLSGYFLRNISTGVLSIPTFDAFGAPYAYSNTTADFIARARAANMTKIVIDLQGNFGGLPVLAYDVFEQFFPNINPFAGSRRRDFNQENILGNSMTDFWDSLTPEGQDYEYDYYYPGLAANEWVITDRLNAITGRNFSSWREYYDPIATQGDIFSQTERYNLTSPLFLAAASGGFVPPPRPNRTPPFSAQNIILLTDGMCGSACAFFVEMMSHEAGVRSVVVGGRPLSGPMQAASGSRGARQYDADTLDDNMEFARAVNGSARNFLPEVRDQAIFTYALGFNLRDQLRRNDSIPLQFKYQAADCRIYYTFANVYNMERLWRDASAAIYTNPGLCVAGSTGFSEHVNSTGSKKLPPALSTNLPFYGISNSKNKNNNYTYTGPGITNGERQLQGQWTSCPADKCPCLGPTRIKCPESGTEYLICGKTCSKPSCGDNSVKGNCIAYTDQPEQKAYSPNGGTKNAPTQDARTLGKCVPQQRYWGNLDVCARDRMKAPAG